MCVRCHDLQCTTYPTGPSILLPGVSSPWNPSTLFRVAQTLPSPFGVSYPSVSGILPMHTAVGPTTTTPSPLTPKLLHSQVPVPVAILPNPPSGTSSYVLFLHHSLISGAVFVESITLNVFPTSILVISP